MRLDGLITGMDTRNIIEQLMELERRPIEHNKSQIENINEKKEMWREVQRNLRGLEDSLSSLKDMDNFESMDVSVDGNVKVSEVGSDAVEARYEVTVDQVAKAQIIESRDDIDDKDASLIEEEIISIQAGDDLTIDIGLHGINDGEDEYVSLNIEREEDSLNISIDGENIKLDGEEVDYIEVEDFSLEMMAEIINENVENIDAKVTNIDDSFRFVLEAEEYGRELYFEDDGEILEDLGFIDGDGNVQNQLQEAQLADFQINGRNFAEHQGNKVTIDGVTIDVSETRPKEEADSSTINVTRDLDTPIKAVERFINSYNSLRKRLEQYGGKEAALQGDSSLRMIQNRMRSAVSNVVNIQDEDGNVKGLVPSNFGIEFKLVIGSSGHLLGLDDENFMGTSMRDKIRESIEENPEEIAQLFAGENGIANRLGDAIKLHTEETIDNRIDSLDSRIDRLNDRIQRRENRIERREENLWRQFSQMEQALSEMWSMQASMRQHLDQMRSFRDR